MLTHILALASAAFAVPTTATPSGLCWKPSYDVTSNLAACSEYGAREGYEARDGGCYQICAQGYTPVAGICVRSCESAGLFDCGATCSTSQATCPFPDPKHYLNRNNFFANMRIIARNSGSNTVVGGLLMPLTSTISKDEIRRWKILVRKIMKDTNYGCTNSEIESAVGLLVSHAMSATNIAWNEKNSKAKQYIINLFDKGQCM